MHLPALHPVPHSRVVSLSSWLLLLIAIVGVFEAVAAQCYSAGVHHAGLGGRVHLQEWYGVVSCSSPRAPIAQRASRISAPHGPPPD
jgi:hypothetical protein